MKLIPQLNLTDKQKNFIDVFTTALALGFLLFALLYMIFVYQQPPQCDYLYPNVTMNWSIQ